MKSDNKSINSITIEDILKGIVFTVLMVGSAYALNFAYNFIAAGIIQSVFVSSGESSSKIIRIVLILAFLLIYSIGGALLYALGNFDIFNSILKIRKGKKPTS